MEYNKIIAVTGMPGLYELLSSKSDGAIVRSLDDKSTRFVASRSHNFSHLESIEVYTVRENVNLVDVLKAMEASSEKLPDEKDNAALKSYFQKVYPDLDFDRVYSSDLKKMVKWFSVLKANNIEIKLTEPEPETEEGGEKAEIAPAEAEVTEEKPAPAKKAAKGMKEPQAGKETQTEKAAVTAKEEPKKAPAKAKAEAAAEEKPKAKKAAPKKKAEKEEPKKTAAKKKK